MLPYFTRIKRYVIKLTCEKSSSFRYFFYEKTVKLHSAFLCSFYGRSFRLAIRKLIIGSYFTNYSKTITHQAEIFQGKLSTIVIFIGNLCYGPCDTASNEIIHLGDWCSNFTSNTFLNKTWKSWNNQWHYKKKMCAWVLFLSKKDNNK